MIYYDCEIWLMQTLSPALKQHVLAASAHALKILNNQSDLRMLFDQIHRIHNRATPINMMKYRLSIQLYKSYNGYIMNDDWMDFNFQQNFNARNNYVQMIDYSNLRVGKNILMNRMGCLNNEIDYKWMTLSMTSFKLKCKNLCPKDVESSFPEKA